MRDKIYWLDDAPEVVASKLMQYHQKSDGWSTNPMTVASVRNRIFYYSTVLEAESWESSLSFQGEQSELVKMVIPQARSIARQFIGVVTKQKLAVQAVALNDGGSDLTEVVRLGNGVGNRLIKAQDLDAKKVDLAEKAYLDGTAYLGAFYRTDRGEEHAVDQETGQMLYKGDVEMPTFAAADVFFDYSIENFKDLDWVEIRVKKNRWDMVAQFPDLADQIMALSSCRNESASDRYMNISDEDMIYAYELYHRITPAMPQGRMLMYSSDKTVYHDGPNEYKKIPLSQFKPEKVQGTGHGYPLFSNLLPAQEMLDFEFSATATNHSAHAVQNVTAPRDANIGVQQISGMNFISFTPVSGVSGGGRPEPLQLTASSPESPKFREELKSHMMELGNLNAALRGSPPPGVTSGAAIATLTTTAIESMTPFSDALLTCIEEGLENGINAYCEFANIERLVEITGKNFQMSTKKFLGSQLDKIKSMKITRINPVMLTSAGRSDLADKLMQAGRVKNVQQYMSILEGAPPEVIFKDELSENDLLEKENEMLTEGETPKALITDDHALHILSHNSLLNDPYIRSSGENLQVILDHILEHLELDKTKDPYLTAMLRTGKAPQQGPPPSGGGGGGAAPNMPADGSAKPAQPADDMLGRPA